MVDLYNILFNIENDGSPLMPHNCKGQPATATVSPAIEYGGKEGRFITKDGRVIFIGGPGGGAGGGNAGGSVATSIGGNLSIAEEVTDITITDNQEILEMIAHASPKTSVEQVNNHTIFVRGNWNNEEDRRAIIRLPRKPDKPINVQFGFRQPESYSYVSEAFKDALEYVDVDFSKWYFEQSAAIAAEGEISTD